MDWRDSVCCTVHVHVQQRILLPVLVREGKVGVGWVRSMSFVLYIWQSCSLKISPSLHRFQWFPLEVGESGAPPFRPPFPGRSRVGKFENDRQGLRPSVVHSGDRPTFADLLRLGTTREDVGKFVSSSHFGGLPDATIPRRNQTPLSLFARDWWPCSFRPSKC